MAELVETYGDLYFTVMKFLGSATPVNTTPVISQSINEAKTVVHDAYRSFTQAADWSFLKPEWQLTTVAGQWEYQLPVGFKKMVSPWFYYSLADSYPPIQETSHEDILCHRAVSDVDSYPERYAVRADKYDAKYGQRFIVAFHPIPDSSYTLNTRVAIMPKKLEDDADLPICGAEYAGVLKQMCLAEAEESQDEVSGVQRAKADRMLAQAISNDLERNPRSLGKMGGYPGVIDLVGKRNCSHLYHTSYDGTRTDTITSGL